MKAKVLKTFRDKTTKVLYTKGKEISINEKRYEEINATALGIFLEKMVEEQKRSEEPNKTENEVEKEKLEEKAGTKDKKKSGGAEGKKKKSDEK
ncbi:hypothetical protein SAMN05660297_02751 [Natronincola peptidivorans]|uniref:Uncharacterized protein n=1 Tax=Natronincola peptidivorans TaxID=426128 RepID=A0A1I0FCI9_9FIRM|nr:hypothetical protein [Natronincola peptidivorans]SET55645.1 hypothetical protein SAMN05660297_02751 [Natronincola peptidivorans]